MKFISFLHNINRYYDNIYIAYSVTNSYTEWVYNNQMTELYKEIIKDFQQGRPFDMNSHSYCGTLISICSQTAEFYEESQQSSLSNSLQGAVVFLTLPYLTDKILNPLKACTLKRRREFWSSCQSPLPGICCSPLYENTQFFFKIIVPRIWVRTKSWVDTNLES